jgi:hypothetical protein
MDSGVLDDDSINQHNGFPVSVYGSDTSDQARNHLTGGVGSCDCDALPLHLAWRKTYVIAACAVLYFNIFVLVVQSFEKVPALRAIAPTQNATVCDCANRGAVLVLFVVLTTLAVKKFRIEPTTVAKSNAKAV